MHARRRLRRRRVRQHGLSLPRGRLGRGHRQRKGAHASKRPFPKEPPNPEPRPSPRHRATPPPRHPTIPPPHPCRALPRTRTLQLSCPLPVCLPPPARRACRRLSSARFPGPETLAASTALAARPPLASRNENPNSWPLSCCRVYCHMVDGRLQHSSFPPSKKITVLCLYYGFNIWKVRVGNTPAVRRKAVLYTCKAVLYTEYGSRVGPASSAPPSCAQLTRTAAREHALLYCSKLRGTLQPRQRARTRAAAQHGEQMMMRLVPQSMMLATRIDMLVLVWYLFAIHDRCCPSAIITRCAVPTCVCCPHRSTVRNLEN